MQHSTRPLAPRAAALTLALMASAALAGCTTVGPKYNGAPDAAPAAAARAAFLRGDAATTTAGTGRAVVGSCWAIRCSMA
jgi:predicted small lipoprotein YifL